MMREAVNTKPWSFAGLNFALARHFDVMAENARLRQLCARAEDLAAHHALMLREGDHRIKNSLQVVASLMRMQAHREKSASARYALLAATARVQSIARIHDALHLTSEHDVIDLGVVLKAMCASLRSMGGDPEGVDITVDVERVMAPIDVAQPIVLAVNELVINALRHAFPGNRAGEIRVSLVEADGTLRIVVADDGQGLPVDHAERTGYGTQLIRMAVAKLGGALSIQSGAGARFELTMPPRKVANKAA